MLWPLLIAASQAASLAPDIAFDAFAVWPEHSYGLAMIAPLASGPFFGTFGLEVARNAAVTRLRADWFGLGVKTRLDAVSNSRRTVLMTARYELAYVTSFADGKRRDGNGHRILGGLMLFTHNCLVELAAGAALGQGRQKPPVLLVGFGASGGGEAP